MQLNAWPKHNGSGINLRPGRPHNTKLLLDISSERQEDRLCPIDGLSMIMDEFCSNV